MPFFVPEKQTVHFLYQLIDGSFYHHPFKAGNNILHTYRTIAMDCLKVHLGLSFSSIDILCWSLQFQEIGHIWKLLCYDVDKQSNLIIGVIFFRDEDDRLLILILVASFIIISMIVIIGVVRFFSYCILSFYYYYLIYLHYWVVSCVLLCFEEGLSSSDVESQV